jgi:hypothetical protein
VSAASAHCSHGAAGAQQGKFTAQAIGAQCDAEARQGTQRVIGYINVRQQRPGGFDSLPDLAVLLPERLDKAVRVLFKTVPQTDDLNALFDILRCADIDRQTEPVQQLRPQFTFFRITAADQQEPRRMPDTQSVTLHHVYARDSDVQQQVHEVVLQQVDFVDVEKSPVGRSQQSGFESLDAGGQRLFQVQCPNDPVFTGTQWQVNHRCCACQARRCICRFVIHHVEAGHALMAQLSRFLGITGIPASIDHSDRWQQSGKRPHCRGLAGAAITQHQHTADT